MVLIVVLGGHVLLLLYPSVSILCIYLQEQLTYHEPLGLDHMILPLPFPTCVRLCAT